MLYLLAIVLPPVYFLVQGRWIAFALTFTLLVASVAFWLMAYLIPLIFLAWFVCAMFAVWDLRQNIASDHRLVEDQHAPARHK
jgi:hypothetical protein